MYLFFDTETTGRPRDYNAPISNSRNWPRIVQLAWVLADQTASPQEVVSYIIRPDGFTIPADASAKHGITTERAVAEGHALRDVLSKFLGMLESVDTLIGHNIEFDSKIVAAELHRLGIGNPLAKKNHICTMKGSTDYCELPGNYGFKWPTLTELHTILFGCDFEKAHDASGDVVATMKCFFRLQQEHVL